MNSKSPLLALLTIAAAGTLVSCGSKQDTKVSLLYGQMFGNVSSWSDVSSNKDISSSTDWANLDYLTSVAYSEIVSKVDDKENFVLVVKGASNGCSCWQEFHESLARYIKKYHLTVYVIGLDAFEKESEHYSIKLSAGRDTIAVFENGAVRYQKTDSDDWPSKTASVSDWLVERINNPKIFYVDESMLNDLYKGSRAFTIYFGRKTCGDCKYVERTSLKNYMFSHEKIEEYTFAFDIDPWRTIVDENGVAHGLRDQDKYDETKTWGDVVTASYNAKKTEFGLAKTDDNPAGYDSGYVPAFFHINPFEGQKVGDVIDAAAVFYNDNVDEEGKITKSYFSTDRLNLSHLDYLKESKVENKALEGIQVPGYKDAGSSEQKHDALRPYYEPIFNAFFDQTSAN